MARRVLEVELVSIALTVTGREDATTRHVAAFSLIWPRPGIAQRVAVKEVSLTDGSLTVAASGWHERILFKETVLGPFALEVSVTEALADGVRDALMRQIAEGVGQGMLVEAGRVVGAGLAGTALRLPVRHMLGALRELEKRPPALVGRGALDLRDDTPPGTVAIALTAPEPIYHGATRQRPGPPIRRDVRLPEGTPSGRVEVRLT